MMRKGLIMLMLCLAQLGAMAQHTDNQATAVDTTVRHRVLLQTSKGDITVELYNETPLHRDNFLRLVRAGYYDGILWHRVISDFMIQTGDSTTRHAMPDTEVGDYDPGYTLPAEIVYPKYFHKRGALAAAREGDRVNPEHRSSASQFYIVYGYDYGPKALDRIQVRLDSITGGKVKFTPEIRQSYMEHGGSPHLDGTYTVFGEVVEGMEVVRDINHVEVDDRDRPLADVRIVRATVVR